MRRNQKANQRQKVRCAEKTNVVLGDCQKNKIRIFAVKMACSNLFLAGKSFKQIYYSYFC